MRQILFHHLQTRIYKIRFKIDIESQFNILPLSILKKKLRNVILGKTKNPKYVVDKIKLTRKCHIEVQKLESYVTNTNYSSLLQCKASHDLGPVQVVLTVHLYKQYRKSYQRIQSTGMFANTYKIKLDKSVTVIHPPK